MLTGCYIPWARNISTDWFNVSKVEDSRGSLGDDLLITIMWISCEGGQDVVVGYEIDIEMFDDSFGYSFTYLRNRRAYVQEEVVEGMNATNETANVQRISVELNSGSRYNRLVTRCQSYITAGATDVAKQDEAGVILIDEQNAFSLLMLQGWKEIEELTKQTKIVGQVFQIVLWVFDSGCSKHMTGDRALLRNFVEKFMGTVRFGNENFAAITGYGDYIHGNITICHVYYVEGLGYNLFSVGQFCDGDLEVAFRSKTCYVRNLEGDDLLTGRCDSNLYTISISDMAASSPICLVSKATSTKSWLWHRRLSHLNFDTRNDLTKLDLVDGLPKFKYGKDHLCSTCERGKRKKASHPPKLIPSDYFKLELLHVDLCGPVRVASV
ncbi:integrase, catalytic region, zinc finger, CCHC-type containing protein, partial [Tanacetum coccineum]